MYQCVSSVSKFLSHVSWPHQWKQISFTHDSLSDFQTSWISKVEKVRWRFQVWKSKKFENDFTWITYKWYAFLMDVAIIHEGFTDTFWYNSNLKNMLRKFLPDGDTDPLSKLDKKLCLLVSYHKKLLYNFYQRVPEI